jgi:hypothetical protein
MYSDRTVKFGRAGVLAPSDAAGGLEVLVDEVAALLVVVDALDPVAPAEALADDLGGLDLDPFFPHQVLPVLQHRYRIPVRVLRVEVIRRALVELNLGLPHHLRRPLLFSPPPPRSLPFACAGLGIGVLASIEWERRGPGRLDPFDPSRPRATITWASPVECPCCVPLSGPEYS